MSVTMAVPRLNPEARDAAGEILLDELGRQLRELRDEDDLPGATAEQRAAFADSIRRAGRVLGQRKDDRA